MNNNIFIKCVLGKEKKRLDILKKTLFVALQAIGVPSILLLFTATIGSFLDNRIDLSVVVLLLAISTLLLYIKFSKMLKTPNNIFEFENQTQENDDVSSFFKCNVIRNVNLKEIKTKYDYGYNGNWLSNNHIYTNIRGYCHKWSKDDFEISDDLDFGYNYKEYGGISDSNIYEKTYRYSPDIGFPANIIGNEEKEIWEVFFPPAYDSGCAYNIGYIPIEYNEAVQDIADNAKDIHGSIRFTGGKYKIFSPTKDKIVEGFDDYDIEIFIHYDKR